MKIKSVMKSELATIFQSDDLHQAAAIMWNHDCGVVPVLDKKKQVVGMITDRDIAMAAYTKGRLLSSIKVGDVMSSEVQSCNENDDLEVAEETMRRFQVRRLPVFNNKGDLTGIISLNDIAQAFSKDKGKSIKAESLARTLSGICAPRQLSASTAA